MFWLRHRQQRRADQKAGEEFIRRAVVRMAWHEMGQPSGTCSRPDKGWFCALEEGHEGPCPSWPEWVR